MPKQSTLTAREAEQLLQKAGYEHVRSKGSHRIYMKGNQRVVIPFYGKKILHPKIVKQVLIAIGE